MKKSIILLTSAILILSAFGSCTKKEKDGSAAGSNNIAVDVSPEGLVLQLENAIENYIHAYKQYQETEDTAKEDSLLIEMIGYEKIIDAAYYKIMELMGLDEGVFTEEQIKQIEALWNSYTEL